MSGYKKILLWLKVTAVLFFIILTISIFLYPFPEPCSRCSIFYKLSYLTFSVLGLTSFFLPVLTVLFFLRKIGRVNKLVKLSLKLWVPILINLALVRELFEIETNIGGLAKEIFDFARQSDIDFLFIFIPIIILDILILFFLGVDIFGLWRKIWHHEDTEDTAEKK